jgi:outer membrane protein OmpA-like peptidoglycan-associated protein
MAGSFNFMDNSPVVGTMATATSFAPILQRQCACGRDASLGGECAECHQKHFQGERRSATSRPLVAAAGAFANPALLYSHSVTRELDRGSPQPARFAFAQPRASDDPSANERQFPRDGRVETVRPGEYLLWNFDINRDRLKSEHQAEIQRIAGEINSVLAQNPEWQVDLEGEASPSGNDQINDPLSARRAENVKNALVTAGVDSTRIRVTSTGSRRALPDVTAENMARSRAVRIILAPRLAPSVPSPAPPATQQTGGPSTHSGACPVTGSAMTLAGGTVNEDRSSGQYQIVAGSGPSAPGILLTGVATLGTAGCGTLEFVQNVQPFREIIYKDGSRIRQVSTSWVLDTSDPYPSQTVPSGSATSLAALANDNPSLGSGQLGTLEATEDLINSMEIRDVFRMFMMIRQQGGIRQTIQMGTWTFIGLARSPSTGLAPQQGPHMPLKLDTTVSRILPTQGSATPTSQSPVLSPNVTSVPYQLDTAGLTGPRIFARLFLPMFQRGAPLPQANP